ncbi:MAG TPA: DUF1990 family protein [Gaiellaceae bacterium]|nr:DUF1990 family protein [Gaiellaceae bacterium]
MRLPELGFGAANVEDRLAALATKPLNYDPNAVSGPGWHRDDYHRPLPAEPPGEPAPGHSWEIACRLSRDYAFADPKLVEAHFDPGVPFEGRDMLLVLRAFGLRIDAGVRVAAVFEGERSLDDRPARLFAWSYRTLEGHIEAGERAFEVWKRLDSGEVEFRTHSFSRPAARNPLVLVGFRLVGRHKQAEFGERACARMATLTEAAVRAAASPARSEAAFAAGEDDFDRLEP